MSHLWITSIYSCTTVTLVSSREKKVEPAFYIKKASLQIWVKRVASKNKKIKKKKERLLMRLLQIRLLFNGLFDYFSQFQAVDFITERSSCKERRR